VPVVPIASGLDLSREFVSARMVTSDDAAPPSCLRIRSPWLVSAPVAGQTASARLRCLRHGRFIPRVRPATRGLRGSPASAWAVLGSPGLDRAGEFHPPGEPTLDTVVASDLADDRVGLGVHLESGLEFVYLAVHRSGMMHDAGRPHDGVATVGIRWDDADFQADVVGAGA
jgi:hypothetical protein